MELFGRLHPLVIHFPIALFIVAAGFELVGMVKKRERHPAVTPLVVVGALSALLSSSSGWVFAEETEFYGSLAEHLLVHRWTGIALAALSTLTAVCLLRAPRLARVPLFICALLVIVVGHIGGELVHGEDHFTKSGAKVAPVVTPKDDVPVVPTFSEQVKFAELKPVLRAKCMRCHGPKKRKGKLRLDSLELALKGGESGSPALVPGDKATSEMFKRVSLPKAHEDFMPSKGEAMSAEEIEALGRWIDQGATWPSQ